MSWKVAYIISAALLTASLPSCIHDGTEECMLTVSFRYDYNVKDADAFASEVRLTNLYIYDEAGEMVAHIEDKTAGDDKGRIFLYSLPAGKYRFEAFASGEAPDEDCAQLAILPGNGTVTAGLSETDTDRNIVSFFCGCREATLEDGRQTVEILLMKLTNRFRLIFMPYDAGVHLSAEDFRLTIDGCPAEYECSGNAINNRLLTFKPFCQETGENTFVVSDINTTRLVYDNHPELKVYHGFQDKEILRIDLAWFLSLQGIAEHRSDWSDQEFLDRQDSWNITLFTDGNRFMTGHIVVNGWVMSLENVPLG